MNRRPLHFITREHECQLIQRLQTLVDIRNYSYELMFYFEKYNKHWPIK